MKKNHVKKPAKQQNIAHQRIIVLFTQAKKMFKKYPALSKRYVILARKIGMKYKVSLSQHKTKFCKHCNNFLYPGANCRVRARNKMMVYTCLVCKHIARFKYK